MAAATQSMPAEAIPSYNRVEPGSVNLPIADFSTIKAVKPQDVDNATEKWASSFNAAIQSPSFEGLEDLFLPQAFWRDHLCLSWNAHTLQGPAAIKDFLKKGCRLKKIEIDRSNEFRKPTIAAFDGKGKVEGIQTFLTTESDVGSGLGVARLVQVDGKLRAFTLFTSMRELKGYEEAMFGKRPEGVAHGGQPGRKNWLERRVADENYDESEPSVLILGMSTPIIRIINFC
jgi:hypothetical protein